MTTPAEIRIVKARTRLLLDFPWFGALSMRLKVMPSVDIPTMGTDGTRLVYNPEWILTIPEAQLVGVLAHEVMHCAMLHPFRRNGRDFPEWNQACDYAINLELRDAGLQLPPDVLMDDRYKGLAAEVIYAKRQQEKRERESQQPKPDQRPDPNGQPQTTPGGGSGPDGQGAKPALSTGEIRDAPKPSEDSAPTGQTESVPMSAEDWKIAAEQATRVARAAGKMPGGVERAAKQARESTEDWRGTLREFIENTAPSDYSWMSPNRRHVANGVYLPGTVRENIGRIAVAIDTSGSIDAEALACFASELTAIAQEARPEAITVLYCDRKINRVEEFAADDLIVLNPCGGGGTRFQPVFDWIAEQDEPPVCLLYFTDLECYDTPAEPEYPVLWVTGLNVTQDGQFGRTVRVDVHL